MVKVPKALLLSRRETMQKYSHSTVLKGEGKYKVIGKPKENSGKSLGQGSTDTKKEDKEKKDKKNKKG